jgi:hypothetical protein
MQVLGYSERGMINSLFYGIKSSQNGLQLLNDFLHLASFPYLSVRFQISDAKILIEQSFSDFGDADSVLLVNNQESKQVVFIEAKVKVSGNLNWSVTREFAEFVSGIENGKVNSSNLFVQLYYKARLINGLRADGVEQLQKGAKFPECFSKTVRKIGSNRVVLQAMDQLAGYCCRDALFLALVPDDISSLKRFYEDSLRNYHPDGFPEWDVTNWGYMSWGEVEKFCKDNKLDGVIENFEFNRGQIY